MSHYSASMPRNITVKRRKPNIFQNSAPTSPACTTTSSCEMTRRLAAGYDEAALENSSALAAVEAEMFQAELDYRSAYTQLKRLVDGR